MVDTSGIELVAQEAAHAGADRMVIVTSPGKQGLAAHFAEDPELEGTLAWRGKFDLLERVRRAPKLLEVETVLQSRPLGLGHAVLQAESALSTDESAIAVLLPDDLVRMPVSPDKVRANSFRRPEDPSHLRDDAELAAVEECSVLETMADVRRRGMLPARPGHLRRAAPHRARRRWRISAHRCHRPVDRPRPSRTCRGAQGNSARYRQPGRIPARRCRLRAPAGGICGAAARAVAAAARCGRVDPASPAWYRA